MNSTNEAQRPASLKQQHAVERILATRGIMLPAWLAANGHAALLDYHLAEIMSKYGGPEDTDPLDPALRLSQEPAGEVLRYRVPRGDVELPDALASAVHRLQMAFATMHAVIEDVLRDAENRSEG